MLFLLCFLASSYLSTGAYCAVHCVFLAVKAGPAIDHDLMQQRKVPLTDTDLVLAAIAQAHNLIPLQAAFINSTCIVYIIHCCVCLMLSKHLDMPVCAHGVCWCVHSAACFYIFCHAWKYLPWQPNFLEIFCVYDCNLNWISVSDPKTPPGNGPITSNTHIETHHFCFRLSSAHPFVLALH